MNRIFAFIILITLCFLTGGQVLRSNTLLLGWSAVSALEMSSAQPEAVADGFETDEDVTLEADVSLNDTFSPGDEFSVVQQPENGLLIFNLDGTFTYTPFENFYGSDSFIYTICNATDECDEAEVVITIFAVNDAPMATDATYTVDFNDVLYASVVDDVVDVDDSDLVFSLVEDVTSGTLILNADGSFTYEPDAGSMAWDSFVYSVCDLHDACDTATVTIFVVDVNESPVAVDYDFDTDEDETLSGDLAEQVTDPNGDDLSFYAYTETEHGVLQVNEDGTFTYTPEQDYNGSDSFIYQVCDTENYCVIANVTITVLPVNDAPVAVDDNVFGEQNDVVEYNVGVNDYDVDGDNLSFALVAEPEFGEITFNADGSFTYSPTIGFYGEDSFQYSVCDQELCDTAMVYLYIDQVLFGPEAIDDFYSVNQGSTLSGDVSENDNMHNGGEGVYSLLVDASTGELELNADGTFSYSPYSGFFGVDSFTYQVCNNNAPCSEAVVTITVIELNTIPVAVDDFFTVEEDGFLAGDVSVNDDDEDGDILTFHVELSTNYGTLNFQDDGSFSYSPGLNFFGTDHFTYSVCDDNGNCDLALVTITVTPVNDAPVAEDDYFEMDQGDILTGYVGDNDSDVDDNQLTFSLLNEAFNGSVEFHSDGTFLYIPNSTFFGEDFFTYTVCDPHGLCDIATVFILVHEGEMPGPEAVNDQFTTNEDEILYGNVSWNDIGLDGYIYSILQNPNHGMVVMETDGSFVYTPNKDFNGFDEFVYYACDMIGNCYNATVNIIIVPQPDDDLEIPMGFSPNGDNVNDKFVIANIDSYPNNTMTIFNRWGNVVYKQSPYSYDNAWDGTSDSGAVAFGSMVSEGTYFYVLETGPSILNSGKSEKKSGYIVVKYESK